MPASRCRSRGWRDDRQALLPHRSHINEIVPLLGTGLVRGMAHAGVASATTFPRTLPHDCIARLDPSGYPAIFDYLVDRPA